MIAAMTTPMFSVTKTFTGGLLKGITTTEVTSVKFPVGFICKKPSGGSPYKVTACDEIVAPEAKRKERLFAKPNLAKTSWSLQDSSGFHLGWFDTTVSAAQWCAENDYACQIES